MISFKFLCILSVLLLSVLIQANEIEFTFSCDDAHPVGMTLDEMDQCFIVDALEDIDEQLKKEKMNDLEYIIKNTPEAVAFYLKYFDVSKDLNNTISSIYSMSRSKYILNFLDALPNDDDKFNGYKYLYENMKTREDYQTYTYLTLCYRAKYYTGRGEHPIGKEFAEEVLKSIPEFVNKFPFEEKFKIKNHIGQVLYASNKIEKNMREVFAINSEHEFDGNDEWMLEIEEGGESYRIKHVKTGGYLYVDLSIHGYEFDGWRRVYVYMGDDKNRYNQWYIEPATTVDNVVLHYAIMPRGILHSANENEDIVTPDGRKMYVRYISEWGMGNEEEFIFEKV